MDSSYNKGEAVWKLQRSQAARMTPPPAFFSLVFTLFRLSETVPRNNCTLNRGSLGARHQESGAQKTNLPRFTLHSLSHIPNLHPSLCLFTSTLAFPKSQFYIGVWCVCVLIVSNARPLLFPP